MILVSGMADDEAPLPQCVSSREEEHLKGSTFRLMKEKLEFLAAKRRCGEWGGSLASLNTIAKVEFVRKMIPEGDNAARSILCFFLDVF